MAQGVVRDGNSAIFSQIMEYLPLHDFVVDFTSVLIFQTRKIYALDFTIIDLYLSLLLWARFEKAVPLHGCIQHLYA